MIQSTDTQTDNTQAPERSIWVRGLLMFVFLILFGLAESLLAILTVFQFFWRVITGQPNIAVRDFGVMLGDWARQVVRFQTMETEIAPFPWGDWPKS